MLTEHITEPALLLRCVETSFERLLLAIFTKVGPTLEMDVYETQLLLYKFIPGRRIDVFYKQQQPVLRGGGRLGGQFRSPHANSGIGLHRALKFYLVSELIVIFMFSFLNFSLSFLS